MNIVLDALLAPIARLAVAKGVLFGQVSERLKLQFLRGAERLAEAPTDSRISVMTGLQRRDIARLRALPEQDIAPVSHLARLVMVWQTDFAARPLPRNGEASFATLAAQIRKDVHPRTLLEQLLAAGTVAEDGDTVRLVAASYQPLAGSDAQLGYLAANGGDYLAAATQNVIATPAPFFERAAHFDGLSAAAVARLDASFRAKQMAVLQEIAAEAAALQKTQAGSVRFRAGGYFYSEDDA